jgi:uncharacterized protein (TIRG00374 family)
MPPAQTNQIALPRPAPAPHPLPTLSVTDALPPRVKAKRSRLRFVITLVLIGLLLNLVLPRVASLNGSLEVLRRLQPWWLLAGAGAQLLCRVAQGLTMRWMVKGKRKLGVWRATLINLAGWSVGLLAGGLVGFASATYGWLRDLGVRAEAAVLAGWLPPLLNAALVGVVALVGAAELLAAGKLSTAESIAMVVSLGILVAAGGAVGWAALRPRPATRAAAGVQLRLARLFRRPAPKRPGSSVQRLLRALRAMGRTGEWRLPMLGSILVVAFDVMTLYFAFTAARHPVRFGVLMAGYGLPMLIGKVLPVPGGVGLVEGSMFGSFLALGVPAPTAALVVMVFRVLSFWIPNLVGMPVIPLLQAQPRVRPAG